jgi:hypothetical protein
VEFVGRKKNMRKRRPENKERIKSDQRIKKWGKNIKEKRRKIERSK